MTQTQATRQKLSVLNGERTQLQQAFEVNIAKSVGSTVQVPLEEMNKCGFIMDFEADDKGMVTLNVDQSVCRWLRGCVAVYARGEEALQGEHCAQKYQCGSPQSAP